MLKTSVVLTLFLLSPKLYRNGRILFFSCTLHFLYFRLNKPQLANTLTRRKLYFTLDENETMSNTR